MPAFPYEYQLAKQDAITFLWHTAPVRVLGNNGVVTGLKCVRTAPGPSDKRGRRLPLPVVGTEFEIEIDMVVRAVGQEPATEMLRPIPGLKLKADGAVEVNERHQTGHPKYFAGGDCTNGGKEVVNAVAEGMAAAGGLDSWLGSPR
jgi:glutamate synthase (NADPH/NADH) small chain